MPEIRKVMQFGEDLYVDGGNGLWYALREQAAGGVYLDELKREDVVLLVPAAERDAALAEVQRLTSLVDGMHLVATGVLGGTLRGLADDRVADILDLRNDRDNARRDLVSTYRELLETREQRLYAKAGHAAAQGEVDRLRAELNGIRQRANLLGLVGMGGADEEDLEGAPYIDALAPDEEDMTDA